MIYYYVEQWRTKEILSNFEGSGRHKLLIKKNKCMYKKTLNVESASCELRVTPLFCEFNLQLAVLINSHF